MTTATDLYVGLTREKTSSILIGPVLGQLVGVEVVVVASTFPLEGSLEQVLGALSLGGIFFGGMAVTVGLTFESGSIALGAWLSARPGSRTRNTS